MKDGVIPRLPHGGSGVLASGSAEGGAKLSVIDGQAWRVVDFFDSGLTSPMGVTEFIGEQRLRAWRETEG